MYVYYSCACALCHRFGFVLLLVALCSSVYVFGGPPCKVAGLVSYLCCQGVGRHNGVGRGCDRVLVDGTMLMLYHRS